MCVCELEGVGSSQEGVVGGAVGAVGLGEHRGEGVSSPDGNQGAAGSLVQQGDAGKWGSGVSGCQNPSAPAA